MGAQSPPSYQETKEPARITKHQRNQKISVEHENTVSPPKKIRNSVRLSAGVRLPKRYEDADLYKPRLDCGQGNRRKRKPGEPVIDSLVGQYLMFILDSDCSSKIIVR
ncbi:hypothetical protein LSTR_LSTR016364 [Laodelphax striatellus]|uniref:Uncharacterized protein n=1 Tax=Laodelphax striatellus TaxID=195883 RepID=A0A482XAJ7_LAOST|nr:hypothetical protein LSTR_LSTR016364 [Laodelphax striatellus]